MPKYLLQARGFDLKATGSFAMLPLLCMAVGVATGGIFSDAMVRRHGLRWGRRIPGLIGLPLAALLLFVAIRTAHAPTAAWLIAFAAGSATLGVAPAWAACLDIGGQHAGVVTGAMNTFGNLGGTALPLYGLLPQVVGFVEHRPSDCGGRLPVRRPVLARHRRRRAHPRHELNYFPRTRQASTPQSPKPSALAVPCSARIHGRSSHGNGAKNARVAYRPASSMP